jgi:NADH dehydrogenase
MTSRSRPDPTQHVDGVLVVGGGYAGLHAASAVADAGVAVTVLEPMGRHDFVTRLAAVAGHTAPTSDASRDLTSFGHDVITGSAIGLADGEVTLDDGSRRSADAVVFCAGAGETLPPIDGIDHALPLRIADHAAAIRERLDPQRPVTIIGGGATGVQLAGAISASRAASVVRIVEMESRLLSTMQPDSSRGAERILRDRGVDVLVDATVERIGADHVVVDGEELPGIVVWAGGFAPRTDGLDVELNEKGQIVIDECLRVAGMTRTFAAGDVAEHRTQAGDGLPMAAQIAVQAGEVAGANAARVVRGAEPERASLSHRGWVLDLSGQRGVAEIGGISLSGPFADLIPPFLHDAIDLKSLFGMGGFSALSF